MSTVGPYSIPAGYAPVSLAALAVGVRAAVGPSTSLRQLEARLAEEYEADRVLLVDSGTTALSLAVWTLETDWPGPVAFPAYSCFDLVTAAAGADADLLFYDLDPATLQPDLESLESTLTAGASRVVVAHLFGVPVDTGPLEALLDRHETPLIEDAAQGLGATVDGRPAGSLARLSVLSFNRGKGLMGGGGGALLARGDDASSRLDRLAERLPRGARSLRPVAIAAGAWLLARPRLYGIPRSLPFLRLGETVYRPPRPPAGLPQAAAGILSRTLALTREEVPRQRSRSRELAEALAGVAGVHVIGPPSGCEPSGLRLPVLVESPTVRAAAMAADRLGITKAYPRALPDLPEAAQRTVRGERAFPGADRLVEGLFTFPTHARLGRSEMAALLKWIDRATRLDAT